MTAVQGPHEWLRFSLEEIIEPFLARHPEHRGAVEAALGHIARDPYQLGNLTEYLGGDVDGRAYVYPVTEFVQVVFGLLPEEGLLRAWSILDWADLQNPPPHSSS